MHWHIRLCAHGTGSSSKIFCTMVSVAFCSASRLRVAALDAIFRAMGDKQLALESIKSLPEDASLEVIAERVEFLAAVRKGLGQIDRGQTIPHDEVKRQLATWLSK